MPLNIGHFITDGKWVLKMSQGTPMDEIIPRNTDDTLYRLKTLELQDLGIYMNPA